MRSNLICLYVQICDAPLSLPPLAPPQCVDHMPACNPLTVADNARCPELRAATD